MESTGTGEKLSTLSTLLLLLGVAVVVGGLLALYQAVHISVAMTAFGSLFLLYWAGIQHQAWSEFLPSLIGGVVGIALAWLLLNGATLFGTGGVVASFAVLAVVLFLYLRGQAHMLVNNGSMLFLLVATIPDLQVGANATSMMLSLVIGAAWIGAISWIAAQVRQRWSRRPAAL